MKLSSITFASALLVATAVQAKTWLLPIPQSVNWTGSIAQLAPNFKIQTSGNDHVKNAVSRYLKLIYQERWVPIQAPEEETPLTPTAALVSLDVTVSDNAAPLQMGVDESYTLDVPAAGGKATLQAATWVGALRGLETFSQLITGGESRPQVHTAHIEDAPAYVHRGISLDTARNFYPLQDILRTVDAMAYNKMNVLHWHVTDSQSWPIVFESHPELSEKGAYSAQEVYNPDDVQALISYAESRGIRVILELDMPAHSAIIQESHPEFMACAGLFWGPLAAEPPAGQINPVSDGAWQLVQDIVKEGTQRFPDNVYHVGGDEINTNCWQQEPSIVSYATEKNLTLHEVWFEWQNKLNTYVLNDLGKRPMMWEDSIRDGGVLPEETIVHVWQDPPRNYTSRYDVVISISDYFYLDCGHGGWVGDDNRYISPTQEATPEDTFNYGGSGGSWCAPFKTWQRIYSYDMTYGIPEDQQHRVLGGEAPLWSEQSGPTVLDARLWPRAASAAEVFWSGSYDKDGVRRSLADMLPRISDWGYHLNARGIGAEPLQPKWCIRHPGQCNLNDPAGSN